MKTTEMLETVQCTDCILEVVGGVDDGSPKVACRLDSDPGSAN